MKKLLLLALLSASGSCFGMNLNTEQLRLNKLLSQLSKQVMACSSVGFSLISYGSHGSYSDTMWRPSNRKDVKQSCDRIFARFVKVEQELSDLDREQE